jgi:hypothetical protein
VWGSLTGTGIISVCPNEDIGPPVSTLNHAK